MAGNTYIVGAEAALQELLHRSDAIPDRLCAISEQLTIITSKLTRLEMNFEENVQLLINYAKALKAQLDALSSGETEAIIAGLQAEVAATAAALAAAQQEIAADTAQEETLGAQIVELLSPPVVVEPEPEPTPEPEPEPVVDEEEPVVGDPIAEPEPVVEPPADDLFVPPADTSTDMVA